MEHQSMQNNNTNQRNVDHFITIAHSLLSDLIQNQGDQCISIFNSQQQPNITIQSFIKRVHRYTQFSKQSLIIAIILLDRYNMANPQFTINYYNVHKIFLTCLLVATKFQDDFYYDNKSFQQAGGVNVAQLMKYQIQIFTAINFNVFVQQQQYQALLNKLQSVYFGQQSQQNEEMEQMEQMQEMEEVLKTKQNQNEQKNQEDTNEISLKQ